MSAAHEYEITYLAKAIPQGLARWPHAIIEDLYVPASAEHPKVRIRRNGDTYEVTKKTPVSTSDKGQMLEETISLTAEEYGSMSNADGKLVSKVRYFMPYKDTIAEIDIFQGGLVGLVIVEVEFQSLLEKGAFTMPDFCLADVTQEEGIAGGKLAGKSLMDITPVLAPYTYRPLYIPD